MNRRHGFTLIELLVVIAIIALLVSILMPSLQKAKELAKDVVCRSHQKSISLAIMLYVEDYDDIFPFGKEPPGGHTTWDPDLSWTIRVGRIADDPNLLPHNMQDPDDTYPDAYQIAITGYIDYNYMSDSEGHFKCPSFGDQVNPKSPPGDEGCESQFSINQTLSANLDPGEEPTPVKTGDVRANSVLIGDGNLNPAAIPNVRVLHVFRTDLSGTRQASTGLTIGNGRLMVMQGSIARGDPPGACHGPWPQQLYVQKWQLAYPCDFPGHVGGASNLAFTDGHVQSDRVINIDDWMIE